MDELALHPDATLIDALGGPTKLAERLSYDKEGGPQRVANWRRRGIPADVKVARPDLFLRHLLPSGQAGAQMGGQAA